MLYCVSEDRKNLAVFSQTYDLVKKKNSQIPAEKRPSLIQYASDIIESNFMKQDWLSKYASHLTFVGIDSNGMVLRDAHLDNKLVEVTYLDGRLWCSEDKPKPCMHVFYAIGRVEVAKLPDLDGKKK